MQPDSSHDQFLIHEIDFMSLTYHSYGIEDFRSPFCHTDGTEDSFGVGEVR